MLVEYPWGIPGIWGEVLTCWHSQGATRLEMAGDVPSLLGRSSHSDQEESKILLSVSKEASSQVT